MREHRPAHAPAAKHGPTSLPFGPPPTVASQPRSLGHPVTPSPAKLVAVALRGHRYALAARRADTLLPPQWERGQG